MNTLFLSREQARRIDNHAATVCHVPPVCLMENAGRSCADVLLSQSCSGPVLVCCGKGNNGGDGLVMARHLIIRGVDVRIVVCGHPQDLTALAAENLRILTSNGVPILEFEPAREWNSFSAVAQGVEWVVDALLGTGSSGPLRHPWAELVKMLNGLPARRFAIDLPSGLDADTGIPGEPTIQADITCTMVAAKKGFAQEVARKCLGRVVVVDIGVPNAWLLQPALLDG